MRDFLVVLAVFGSIPFILAQPQIGILMWYWVSLMNPHRLAWTYSYDLRVALIVGGATLLAWIFSRERKLPPSTATNWLLAAFTFWVSVSTVFAQVPDAAFAKWVEVVKIIGMTFLTTCIVNSKDRILQVVWIATLSIGFYGVKGGVFEILTGGNYRVWGPPDSFIGDNNDLTLAMIMILPLLHFLTHEAARRWLRLGIFATMGLTVIAILGTYSRGGLIALGVTLVAFLVKAKRAFLGGLLAVLVLGGTLAFLPASWYERMETIATYEKDRSADERLTSWLYALRLSADRPLTGGGFDVVDDSQLYFAYVPNADAVHNFHSIYFQVLGENGYPGLFLFLGLIIGSLFTAQWIIRKARDRPDLEWAGRLSAAIQVSIVGYCTAGSFLNLGFYDLFYALVAVVTSTRVVVVRAIAERPAESAYPTDGKLAAQAPSPDLATIGR